MAGSSVGKGLRMGGGCGGFVESDARFDAVSGFGGPTVLFGGGLDGWRDVTGGGFGAVSQRGRSSRSGEKFSHQIFPTSRVHLKSKTRFIIQIKGNLSVFNGDPR